MKKNSLMTLEQRNKQIIDEKEYEVEQIKTFCKNLDLRQKTKQRIADKSKGIRKETKKYKARTNTKKYNTLHNHTLKNFPEILYIQDQYHLEEGIRYTDEQIYNLASKYIELCDLLDYPITISGICLFLGINEASQHAKRLHIVLKPYYESMLLSNRNNVNLTFFMKHRYNRNDKITIDNSQNSHDVKNIVDQIIHENDQNKSLKDDKKE